MTFIGSLAGRPIDPLVAGVLTVAGVTVGKATTGVAGVGAVQRVTLPMAVSGGTFTLGFAGRSTSEISWSATAGQVQTALESVGSIGVGNVTVAAVTNGWDVTFTGSLRGQAVELLTTVSQLSIDASASGGYDGSAASVLTTTAGASAYRIGGLFGGEALLRAVPASGSTVTVSAAPVAGVQLVLEGAAGNVVWLRIGSGAQKTSVTLPAIVDSDTLVTTDTLDPAALAGLLQTALRTLAGGSTATIEYDAATGRYQIGGISEAVFIDPAPAFVEEIAAGFAPGQIFKLVSGTTATAKPPR